MVIFLRSTDGNPDSRLQKYTDFLDKKQIKKHILCWDRFGKFENNNTYTYFHRKAVYGNGIKNGLNLLLFNYFLIHQLFLKRKVYHTIHACDFDTIIPALFMKLLFNKKVIYDIFDWFVDSREFQNKYLKSAILFFEKIALKKSDVTIICEEERRNQLCTSPKKLWVLPNIPNFKKYYSNNHLTNYTIKISYVGVLTKHRGIEKFIEAVKNNLSVELHIAGFGELQDFVESASKEYKHIHYYGSVKYEDGLDIMNHSDLILAIYETDIPNHIYAAPNKYYEGLYLGKPILTTKGTFVGNKTDKYQTGFTIGEKIEDIHFFLKNISPVKLMEYGVNAKKMWGTSYINYVENFMNKKYLPFIN